MAALGEFSTDQKIAELRREIAMRNAVYPGLIRRGKLRQEDSQHRVAVLNAILRDYEAKRAEGPLFNPGGY